MLPLLAFSITPNRFNRTAGQRLVAGGTLDFIFGLLTDVGIRVLERASEVFGRQVATDVAVNASAVDIEGPGDVLFYFVVSIGHESADYADFTD